MLCVFFLAPSLFTCFLCLEPLGRPVSLVLVCCECVLGISVIPLNLFSESIDTIMTLSASLLKWWAARADFQMLTNHRVPGINPSWSTVLLVVVQSSIMHYWINLLSAMQTFVAIGMGDADLYLPSYFSLFKTARQPRLTLNSKFPCLYLLSARITSLCHHIYSMWCRGLNPRLPA